MTRRILHALSSGIGIGAVPVLLAAMLATHPRMFVSGAVALLVAALLRFAGLFFPAPVTATERIERNNGRRVLSGWQEHE